jgi:hypothetical protein
MAVESLCAKLLAGQDNSCSAPIRKYEQQIVVINKSDIEEYEITKTNFSIDPPVCAYNVNFTLKDGKTGYRIIGPQNGSAFSGTYAKSTSDLGYVQYQHIVNMLTTGFDETSKCITEALDKGSYIVAMQVGQTIEIYGIENGLTTGDYTNDPQANGGGNAVTLQSLENTPENSKPLVYVSNTPGSELEDFDDAFANSGS